MLIPTNGRALITSAITIRSKLLIFMVLLLVTRARKCDIKGNHDHFYESLNLDDLAPEMILLLRKLTIHYWTMWQNNYADLTIHMAHKNLSMQTRSSG